MKNKIIKILDLVKSLRRLNHRKTKVIQPKNLYNKKDKSWSKDV